jgi:hypothetical protein
MRASSTEHLVIPFCETFLFAGIDHDRSRSSAPVRGKLESKVQGTSRPARVEHRLVKWQDELTVFIRP